MPRSYGQTAYDVNQDGLPVIGKPERTQMNSIMSSIDSSVDSPLRLRSAQPTSDSKLYIGSNRKEFGDGSGKVTPPADDTIQTYAETTIDFQTGAISGGTVTRNGAAFSLPSSTIGQYRRVAFVYQSQQNRVDCTFSAEVAALGSLADAGSLFSLLDGLPIGYIDIEATAATAFKTPGAASNIISNKVGSDSFIWNFGSGSGSGAGAITDLKFQSVSGTDLVIKKGYMSISDGKELYLANDLTYDLSGITVDGDYYGYIDLYSLPSATDVNGREVYALTSANFVFSTDTPDSGSKPSSRYAPVGALERSGGTWQNQSTRAVKQHVIALGADASLVYQKSLAVVGDVGDADNFKAGHDLQDGSFPTGLNKSWYNMEDANDEGPSLRNLTNNGTIPFTGTGVEGVANKCAVLNGTTQYFSSTDSGFNPGDNDFTVGGWFKPNQWESAGSAEAMFSQWDGIAANQSFFLKTGGTKILWLSGVVSSTQESKYFNTDFNDGEWHHLVLRYVASANRFDLFADGNLLGSMTLSGALQTSGADNFQIGAINSSDLNAGSIDEFFFVTNSALSDNAIHKIYSAKISHNKTVSASNQKWLAWGKASGITIPVEDYIVDMQPDDLYVDFSNHLATTQIELKLQNAGSLGLSKSSRSKTLEMTASELDALLPLTHNLGVVPEITFKKENGANDYEYEDEGSVFVATSTQIKLAGTGLTSLYGASTNVILNYSAGGVSQYIPDKLYNAYKASGTFAIQAWDQVFIDTSGGVASITLPANPKIGDTVEGIDFDGSWGTNGVTVSGGSNKVHGNASGMTFDVAGDRFKLVFNGTDDWRLV